MLIRLLILAPSGECFEWFVSLDKKLRELAKLFLESQGWPLQDEQGRGQRAVVELVSPENPDTTRRLNGDLSISEAGLQDGDKLRISVEANDEYPPVGRFYADAWGGLPLTPVSRSPEPANAVIKRHTDVSFPSKVRVGQTTNLRVRIVELAPRWDARSLSMSLKVTDGPIRVTVYVTAENFTIEGPTLAVITVPLEGDSDPVHFRLTGEAAGPGRVMLDFVQDGRPLGSIDLSPVVVTADLTAAPEPADAQGQVKLRAGPAPAPDVTIIVHEYHSSLGRLHFSLLSTHQRLRDLPLVMHGDLGSVDLKSQVVDWVNHQLDTLNDGGQAAAQDARRLGDVGNRIFSQLLPEKLQELCWTFHQRGVRSVMIFSDEPHIPWELVKPCRPDRAAGAIEQLPFWGESFALGRWLRGPATTERFTLNRVCAVAAGGTAGDRRDILVDAPPAAERPDPFALGAPSSLKNVDKELAVIRSLESTGVRVRVLPPRRAAVRAAFEEGDFTLFHLMSHGAFGGASAADASAVLLEDGTFRAAELAPSMAAALRRTAPLIVFNACSTGRSGYSLTRLGSWGAELIRLGCGGFVGTLWRVTDAAAVVFARAFYQLLAAGAPIGVALWQARLAVRRDYPDDPTWLAYCCFADPTARVETAAERGSSSAIGPAARRD